MAQVSNSGKKGVRSHTKAAAIAFDRCTSRQGAFERTAFVSSPTEMYREYGVGRIIKIRGEQAKVAPT